MKTELAILARELYQHFGSSKSRRHMFYTFAYAFLLGCVANFAANFVAALLDQSLNIYLGIVSMTILIILVLVLLLRQYIIFGVPKSFNQSFILANESGISASAAKDLVLKAIQSLVKEKVSAFQENKKILVKKKRLWFHKTICAITQDSSLITGNIELNIKYSNNDLGERFAESLTDNLYFQSIKESIRLIVDLDSRPFGKLLVQSRFDLIDEAMRKENKKQR